MRSIIVLFWFFSSLNFAQDEPEMKVYIKNNNMEKGYRTLKTTFSDSLIFKKKYKGSNYSLYRHLSKKCQDVMGYSQTNKWVMDQIIDIDSVEILKKILEVYDSVTKT